MVDDDIAPAELPVQKHTGSIRRAIVDHDHLALAARRQRRGHNAANDFREDRPLVVDGDDDGNLHLHWTLLAHPRLQAADVARDGARRGKKDHSEQHAENA